MIKKVLGLTLEGPGGMYDKVRLCVWSSQGTVRKWLTLEKEDNSIDCYVDDLGFHLKQEGNVITVTPFNGISLCCANPNNWHGDGGYLDAVRNLSRKSATITFRDGAQPQIEFQEFLPIEKTPKYWFSIVNTPSGHNIITENGATPLFGHDGIIRFHTIDEMKEKKKVGTWSFHLGSTNLPIIMEITSLVQCATIVGDKHDGCCDLVFRPVDGRMIRCFNGNPHLMGKKLTECSGFQVSLSSMTSHFDVTDVTYLPLEQDK